MRVERDVGISMRDGTRLVCDVYLADELHQRPTLLHRTPYGKCEQVAGGSLDERRLVESGFNLVVQDVRGRFGSEGRFEPYGAEASDGGDSIEWIAQQPWSDGWVGMVGRSYAGVGQWLTAGTTTAPRSLRAIAPEMCTASVDEGWTFTGGALQLAFCLRWLLEDLAWPTQKGRGDAPLTQTLRAMLETFDAHCREPWTVLNVLDRAAPYYRGWLEHQHDEAYWAALGVRDGPARTAAPTLVISGWFDPFVMGALRDFADLGTKPASLEVRELSRLVVGPWSHDDRTGAFPDRDFGEGARLDLTEVHVQWFDAVRVGCAATIPRVRVFVMGADRWLRLEHWPPSETRRIRLYLHRGALRSVAATGEDSESFVYDPEDPVPSVGGALTSAPGDLTTCGPRDQRELDSRGDILRFLTAPLEAPLTIVGEVVLVLYASWSAPTTDFTGKLVDVAPNGTATLVCDGILRVGAFADERVLGHLDVRRLELVIGVTATQFSKGHRIRVDVSSSNAPRFDANPNTGAPSRTLEVGTTVRSVNRVHYGGDRGSHLLLPVLNIEFAVEART